MTDEMIGCPCGFRAVKSQIHKTSGVCPRCGTVLIEGLSEMHAKTKKTKEEIKALIDRRVA